MLNWMQPPSTCLMSDLPPDWKRKAEPRIINCYSMIKDRAYINQLTANKTVPHCMMIEETEEADGAGRKSRLRILNLRPLSSDTKSSEWNRADTRLNTTIWLPSELRRRLEKEAPWMSLYEMRYWWRAQSTAYLMRFNERTVSRVAELRWNVSMMQHFPPHAHFHPLHLRAQQTLPPGSISAHVRGARAPSHQTFLASLPYSIRMYDGSPCALASQRGTREGSWRIRSFQTSAYTWQRRSASSGQIPLELAG